MRFFRSRTIFTVLLLVLLFVFNAASAASFQAHQFTAQDSVSKTLPGIINEPIDGFLLFVKTTGIVVVFSGLLYVFLRLYKKSVYGNVADNQANQIKLLGTQMVGYKKSISIIRVLDHILVLGLSDEQMTVLLDVPVDELDENTRNNLLAKRNISDRSFKQILNVWMKK